MSKKESAGYDVQALLDAEKVLREKLEIRKRCLEDDITRLRAILEATAVCTDAALAMASATAKWAAAESNLHMLSRAVDKE